MTQKNQNQKLLTSWKSAISEATPTPAAFLLGACGDCHRTPSATGLPIATDMCTGRNYDANPRLTIPTRATKTTVERLFSLSTSENRIPAFLLARGPSSAGRVLSRLRLAGGGCRRAPIVRLRGRRSVRSGVVFVVVWPIRGVCCFLIAPRTNDAWIVIRFL